MSQVLISGVNISIDEMMCKMNRTVSQRRLSSECSCLSSKSLSSSVFDTWMTTWWTCEKLLDERCQTSTGSAVEAERQRGASMRSHLPNSVCARQLISLKTAQAQCLLLWHRRAMWFPWCTKQTTVTWVVGAWVQWWMFLQLQVRHEAKIEELIYGGGAFRDRINSLTPPSRAETLPRVYLKN